MEKQKTVIVVAGPTAVGKTAVAIQLAQAFQTAIISADSRQCYREMKIGVARPSQEELQTVPHYFVASHSIHDELNAAVFADYALDILNGIFQSSDIAVVCGGTGLYIKSLCEGLDDIPAIDPEIRQTLIASYELNGISWLRETMEREDQAFFAKGEAQNPHRLLRALEVIRSTGRSILDWQRGQSKQRNFNCLKIGLDLPRNILYQRINERVDQMIASGLVEEVKELFPFRMNKALQTVGYQELFAWMEGVMPFETAIEKIKQHSRNYAKRQLTWFRRDPSLIWFSPDSPDAILDFIRAAVPA